MESSSKSEYFFKRPLSVWHIQHELEEEVSPYARGEWLKLKPADNENTPKSEIVPSMEKKPEELRGNKKLGETDEKGAEEENEEEGIEIKDSECCIFDRRNILRGPVWYYGLRSKSLDTDFYNSILFGAPKTYIETPVEMILKGEEWAASKPVTSSMAVYIFRRLRKISPEKTALVELETGRTLTYGELVQKARSLSYGLYCLGLQDEQVVVIVSYNSLEAHIMVLACLLLGAVVALVDSSLNPIELSIVFGITGPHLVFTEAGKTQSNVKKAISYVSLSSQKRKPQVIINSSTIPESKNDLLFGELLRKDKPTERVPGPRLADPNRPVMISYTGIPKNPKACLISERFFTYSKPFVETMLPSSTESSSTLMVTPPMFCILAIKTVLNNLLDGHKIVFSRGHIPVPCLINALHRFDVFAMLTVNTTLTSLLSWPARPRCPRLVMVAVIMLPLRLKDLIRIKSEVFNKNVKILQIFDLVETGAIAVNTFLVNKLGSVGKLFYNVEMKVLDENTRLALGPGQEGELCVKSPTVFLGYYNCGNPSKLDSEVMDHEGFIHTGTLGYYDDEGFVYVTDKVNDVIKWRTYAVSPSRVEAVLIELPAVKEALVFGLFDEEDGEVVSAAVIFESGYEQTDLAAFEKQVNMLLSYTEKIRGGVYACDRFPRSSLGKPMREYVVKDVMERKMTKYRKNMI